MFEKQKLTILSLVFLIVAVCFIFIDVKNTEKNNLTLKYISENSRDFSRNAIFEDNTIAPSKSEKGHRARILQMPDSLTHEEATIKSSYFEKKNREITFDIISNGISFSNNGLTFLSKKKNDLINASSSSSVSSGLLASLTSGRKSLSSENSFAQNKSSLFTPNSGNTPSGPMKVGGDDDPGEPPIAPVGEGLWILLLGALSFFVYKKIRLFLVIP